LADVGMIDAGRCTRLPPEALPLLTVAETRANPLDGDGPVQALVMRGIHDAHTTFSELAPDAIATKRFQRASSSPVDMTLTFRSIRGTSRRCTPASTEWFRPASK